MMERFNKEDYTANDFGGTPAASHATIFNRGLTTTTLMTGRESQAARSLFAH